jgi:hypothetical protein
MLRYAGSSDAVEIKGIRKFEAQHYAVAIEFLGTMAAFVLAEHTVILVATDKPKHEEHIHDGAILCSVRCGERLLTGGDDGGLVAMDQSGLSQCIFRDGKGRWIDHVAADRDCKVVWSIGKEVFQAGECAGVEVLFRAISSIGGLTFSPVTKMLAIAHYNGVSLCDLRNDRRISELEWKGSHQGVTFSPDGKILVSVMREPTLHAWRLADLEDLPVPGYPSRVSSVDWTASGRFLATAGSDRLVLLSFQAEDNPLAQMPLLLAPYKRLVAVVACHPLKEIAAVGYEDGLVLLVRIPDGAEILVKAPDASAISAMKWDETGTQLAAASESGHCRIYQME